MTRIFGLLSFFDESPLWLAALMASAAPYVDHWIAVDGRYALYPHHEPQSRVDQAQAIVETAQATRKGLTLHRPNHAWAGNEIEKRTRMFQIAEHEATLNTDWYMVLDADILIDRGLDDIRDQLANTDHDTAEVMVIERGDPYRNPARLEFESTTAAPPDIQYPIRALFRAVPGLHCDRTHYHYTTGDGRLLWGQADTPGLQPALDLRDFRLEHRTHHRPLQRHVDAQNYYRLRDHIGVEALP